MNEIILPFRLSFAKIAKLIRDYEADLNPELIQFWLKKPLQFEDTYNTAKITTILVYKVGLTYRVFPYLGIKCNLHTQEINLIFNSSSSIQTKTLESLLTHSDENIRQFVQSIDSAKPEYEEKFDPSLYFANFRQFKKALKEKYPDFQITETNYQINTPNIFLNNLQPDITKTQSEIFESFQNLLDYVAPFKLPQGLVLEIENQELPFTISEDFKSFFDAHLKTFQGVENQKEVEILISYHRREIKLSNRFFAFLRTERIGYAKKPTSLNYSPKLVKERITELIKIGKTILQEKETLVQITKKLEKASAYILLDFNNLTLDLEYEDTHMIPYPFTSETYGEVLKKVLKELK